jgi:hypothetical protein
MANDDAWSAGIQMGSNASQKRKVDKSEKKLSGIKNIAGNPNNSMQTTSAQSPLIGSKKKGGKVKRTGAYRLHKGERVLTVRESKDYRKKMKKRVSKKA